jgi:hypothetical protein
MQALLIKTTTLKATRERRKRRKTVHAGPEKYRKCYAYTYTHLTMVRSEHEMHQ